MDDSTDEAKPPYLPFQTFASFLAELGTKPLPPQIDRSMMSSKSGTDQANLFSALKFFGLIGPDQAVQPALRELVESQEEDRKRQLAVAIKERYPTQIEVSSRNGTEKLLLDSFDSTGYTGDTKRKAMTFFLHAARWAGMPLSPHFPVTRMGSGRPATARPKRIVRKRSTADAAPMPQATPRAGGGERLSVSLGSAGDVTVEVNVRWLDLEDVTFTKLRSIIGQLRALGADVPPDDQADEESAEESPL